eukprot:6683688-Pyramimonas_sp.AAC.1
MASGVVSPCPMSTLAARRTTSSPPWRIVQTVTEAERLKARRAKCTEAIYAQHDRAHMRQGMQSAPCAL